MAIWKALKYFLRNRKKQETGKDPNVNSDGAPAIDLAEVDYNPGYNDMAGESHQNYLRFKDGKWTVRSIDRSPLTRKETETAYEVDAAAVAELEAFITENNICGLTDRKDSGDFITDYTPWSFNIVFGKVGSRSTFRFGQYQDYSGKDKELIGELKKRFEALKKPDRIIK